jgi:ubiquinone/menaquinone biosynthesis C-methylase UbiE
MPYPDGAFSVIWNQGSLNHDPAWLDEFDRVLRPGGRLALVFEHRPEQGPRHEADSRWTMAETAARVAALGYEIRHLDDLTEREIALGWERMIRRLDERREVYLAAKGAEWIEAAKRVHRGNRRHAPAGVEQRAPDRDETRRRIGMKLTREQLFDIAATVPQRQGWDYSQVRDAREPVPWDYVDVVRRYLKPGDRVLDCGTGGGERFLSLSDAYRLGVGLDPDPEMLEVAQANADRDGVSRVEWVEGCGEALPVADNSMDVVLNRHAVIDPVETLRVLRPSGLLIMQEVGARNLQAICTTFGCGPGGEYVFAPADSIYRLADRFRALGSTVLAVAEYDVPYTLLDIPSLLFLLRGVGIPEDYDLGRHWPQVLDIIERCGTHEGIVTNEHRELLIVRSTETQNPI